MSYLSVAVGTGIWTQERVQIGNKDLRNIQIFIEVWRMKGIRQEDFVGCPLSRSLGKHQYKGTNNSKKIP